MRQMQCVVVGAGALGNEVARILGLLGTAKVLVVDPDTVEATNLPRSIFFCVGKALGQNKAQALAAAATDLFPNTQWTAIESEIADVGFQRLAGANLFFCCADSDLARLEMAYVSGKLRIPMVDGGLGARNYSQGRVTYFPGVSGQACYGCMLSPRKRRELLELWQATLRPCSPANGNAGMGLGSTPTMAGIIGCMQAELGLRSYFDSQDGQAAGSRSFEVQLHPIRRIEEFAIPVGSDCPFHHYDGILRPLPRGDATFEELLDSAGAEAVVLDWPICVEARCLDCGKEWPANLRLAALRRRGRCPACESRDILELKTLRTIGRESAWLRQKPSALQLPADHLYNLRNPGTL
jgi:molybdopterin/thiamine biosynthesis adenylyltransferase/DNA-directed RNA polymerase subunit RPC12/RpoP